MTASITRQGTQRYAIKCRSRVTESLKLQPHNISGWDQFGALVLVGRSCYVGVAGTISHLVVRLVGRSTEGSSSEFGVCVYTERS
ncbi:hypothetical protein FHG87_010225 [Trinorchestia longiramus]|nr:hypothetical protein FHG87_010225 [Trinorchestia longiramus]